MTEDQLRAIVRDAVTRHLSKAQVGPERDPPWKMHASHARLAVSSGEQTDGPCLIEPVVACNHCGFCQSFGH